MKTVVEFGVRGGRYCDCQIMPSAREGNRLAHRLAFVFGAQDTDARFTVCRQSPRQSWQSATHFVSVSLIDDAPRGPATPKLHKANP